MGHLGLIIYSAVRAVASPRFSLLGFIIMLFIGGLIIGALGRLIVPGRQPMGILATAAIGVAGSIIGGVIGRLLFGPHYVPGLLISVLGAALLVLIVSGRRTAPY
jgi:uncharacterized membrane protein YeaQ/YmgE (transglycosylase-associated protein family)